jgi:hypothetical protein
MLAAAAAALLSTPLNAQTSAAILPTAVAPSQQSCDFSDLPGVVWWGTQRQMTLEQLAHYLAPVYWLSPDEPLLNGAEGVDIRIPEAFPFEEQPDGPVVYYQFGQMIVVAEGVEGFDETAVAIVRDSTNPGNAVVDFERVVGFTMHFWAYFSSEEGIGAHIHDIEGAEFRLVVFRDYNAFVRENSAGQCSERNYVIVVTRVSGLAHGIVWFWNVSETDGDSRFPMHLLVEEGKHALATDKNSDGYFTPGYDVSRYVNDAWGVRDNMRTGALATGGYQAWMTKVRQPEHRLVPPLPDDSPLRPRLERRGYYDGSLAVYELRPFPPTQGSEQGIGVHQLGRCGPGGEVVVHCVYGGRRPRFHVRVPPAHREESRGTGGRWLPRQPHIPQGRLSAGLRLAADVRAIGVALGGYVLRGGGRERPGEGSGYR